MEEAVILTKGTYPFRILQSNPEVTKLLGLNDEELFGYSLIEIPGLIFNRALFESFLTKLSSDMMISLLPFNKGAIYGTFMLNKQSFQIIYVNIVVRAVDQCQGKLYWFLKPQLLSPYRDYRQDILERDGYYISSPQTPSIQNINSVNYITGPSLIKTSSSVEVSDYDGIPTPTMDTIQQSNRKRKFVIDDNDNHNISDEIFHVNNSTNAGKMKDQSSLLRCQKFNDLNISKGCDRSLELYNDQVEIKRAKTNSYTESKSNTNSNSDIFFNGSLLYQRKDVYTHPSKSTNTDQDLTCVAPLTKENIHLWESTINSRMREIESTNHKFNPIQSTVTYSLPLLRAQSIHNCTVASNSYEEKYNLENNQTIWRNYDHDHELHLCSDDSNTEDCSCDSECSSRVSAITLKSDWFPNPNHVFYKQQQVANINPYENFDLQRANLTYNSYSTYNRSPMLSIAHSNNTHNISNQLYQQYLTTPYTANINNDTYYPTYSWKNLENNNLNGQLHQESNRECHNTDNKMYGHEINAHSPSPVVQYSLSGGLNKHSQGKPLGESVQHRAVSNNLHCCT